MNVHTVLVFLFIFSYVFPAAALEPIQITDSTGIVHIDSSFSRLWNPVNKTEHRLSTKYFTNKKKDFSYWYTFKIHNATAENINWYLVSYNFTLNEIDFVEVQNGVEKITTFRNNQSLYDRLIEHKQPVFSVSIKPNETKQYFIRLKNSSSFYYEFALYSSEKFASSFLKENLEFGLFYGFMLFVLIYNIFYYTILKEKVVLYYCLFILSQIIHMAYRDGTGFFLTPYYTEYSEIFKNIARTALAVFLLLYTYYYFKASLNKRIFKLVKAVIFLRLIYAVVMYQDNTLMTFHFELFALLFCSAVAIYSYKKNNSDSKFMIVGLVLLTISYIIYYLSVVAFSSISGFGFFALYYGIACESIFMTLALTERFKRIKLENTLTIQMNNKLELEVQRRTYQIEEKNKQLEEKSEELNLFLYSASHDLRGPLRTIDGLCNLGLTDDASDKKQLFELIKKKLSNLESNISDLNSVTKIQNQILPQSEINFDLIHANIVERFVSTTGLQHVEIVYQNLLDKPFESDNFSIKSIYQNIFENALKYRDRKRNLHVEIRIEELDNNIRISFKDNGLGIPESILPKIFNMFYRGNTESKDDTGLGLYIVKKAVVKLGGTIDVSSKVGEGTEFIIILPRV
ncbi:MAG: 7TM diverse intracellular signaling domain-containing protein [Cytophaga sp.]